MQTRRGFLKSALGAGAGLALGARHATAQTAASQIDRNRALVRRFKESQGTPGEAAAMREVLSPNYKRARAGMENLANNARDQGFPGPGQGLRDAFPDRADIIEDMVAEGDQVGMLWRAHRHAQGQLPGHTADRQKNRRLRSRFLPRRRRQDHGRLVHGR